MSSIQWFKRMGAQPIFWVLLLALGIRIYAGLTTHIVNPDGIHYIYQARAVYYQDWQNLTSCHISYVSLLPFLIAAAFTLVHDWVVASRVVVLLFSFASLIPLYYICKRFFDRAIAVIAMLVYAMIPAFVGRSADIIRDPIFWPFITWGLFFFVRYWDRPNSRRFDFNLPLSCLLFLLATWTRVEGGMYLVISAIYLLWADKEHRFNSSVAFLSPIFLMAGLGLLIIFLADVSVSQVVRFEKMQSELLHLWKNYQSIDIALNSLVGGSSGQVKEFLRRTHEVMWFVPVGAMLGSILEKFFYPYVLIWIWGFFNCGWLLKKKPVGYFLFATCVAFIVLYAHLINTWLIYDRFLSILILPAVLIVANGCKNIIEFLQGKFSISKKAAVIALCIFILVFGLGINLKPRYEEKKVFSEIGQTIRQNKVPGQLVRIAATPSNAYEWVFFYANLDWPGAPCAGSLVVPLDNDYDRFISSLNRQEVRFVLCSDRELPGMPKNLFSYQRDLEVLSKWQYENSETYYLLMTR